MQWFRSYHGTVDDPKIVAVSIVAKVHRCFVLGVWQAILEHASSQKDRGDISNLTAREIGIRLVMGFEEVEAIMYGMRLENMIDDTRVIAWEKRQKPSDSGAKRIAEHRRRAKLRQKKTETTAQAASAESATEENVTLQDQKTAVTFSQTLKIDSESTIVDSSPPLPPRHETISPSAQSASADVFDQSLPDLLELPAKAPAGPKPKARSPVDAEFAEFWAAYPRKVGKGHAEKAWRSAVKIADVESIVAGLKLAVMEWEANGTEHNFIPHPSSWLNGQRWADERTKKPAKNGRYVIPENSIFQF